MADQFSPILAAQVLAYSTQNNLGWNIYEQATPARREWNTLPMVIVCPYSKNDVRIGAFQYLNIHSQYQIFYVSDNALDNTQSPVVDAFIKAMIANFMPASASQRAAGAWQSRVIPSFDYDRSLFPKGYTVSCVEVDIDWVSQYTQI